MLTGRKVAWFLTVLLVATLVQVSLPLTDTVVEAQGSGDCFDPVACQDQDDTGSGGGGGCTYCSQTACGCSSPPPGCILRYSCACSSIDCRRSCDYDC